MFVEPADDRTQRAGLKQDVTVNAADDLGVGLPEDEVTDRGATVAAKRDVAQVGHPVLERLEVIRRRPLGMVVDDQEGELRCDFRVKQPDRLDREPHPIEIVVGRHSDAHTLRRALRRLFGNGATGALGLIELS